jgi:cell division protein ZapA
MKQLEVQIMGQSYLLAAPEGGEQQLLTAVEKVDTAMCRIRDAGKVKARDRIAVLAALNLAFETDRKPAADTILASTGRASNDAGTADMGNHLQLATLIAKLDAALGHDGQLL